MSERGTLQTTAQRSRLMANVRQTRTWIELVVQEKVRSLGYQFRANATELPGTPDIVNDSAHWAIFVHGCYWHAHDCHLWKIPTANRRFWKRKFEANRRRDQRKLKDLQGQGYSCLTIWQCELDNEPRVKRKLLKFLRGAQGRNGHVNATIGSHSEHAVISYEAKEKEACVLRAVSVGERRFETTRNICPRVPLDQDARSLYDQVFLRSAQSPSHPPSSGTVRAADLFSGCGGLSLGAREASIAIGKNFQVALAIDTDQAALSIYETNFKPLHALNLDIWSVLTGEIGDRLRGEEKKLIKKLGGIDLCLAGPPCQGNSDLNNHTRRKDVRNQLYERVGRFAEVASPSHIIIENVPTIIHGKDRALDRTIERLERLGYRTAASTINLATLGVPQKRKRHVVVASGRSISIEQIVKAHSTAEERTVRWAISDLARKSSIGAFDAPSVLTEQNRNRIEYLMKTDTYDLPNHLRPLCHQDEHSYVSMYGRLNYDDPAQTITSGFGSPGQGRYIHPTCRRTLTPHEAARLQFFPDSFDFSSVKLRTALANMIGNAVPMVLSLVICFALLI